MNCSKCGVPVDARNKFCSSCGAVVEMQPQDRANQFTPPPNNSKYHPSNHEHSPMKNNKNKKTVIIACAAVLLVVGLVAVLLFTPIFNSADQPLTVWEMIDLGEKYLRELEYEQALEQFLEVIEIEPRNPRGYTGAAEAYIGLDREDDAIAILEVGLVVIGESESIRVMLETLSDGGGTVLEPTPTPEPPVPPPTPEPTPAPTPQITADNIYAAYYQLLSDMVNRYGLTDFSVSFDDGLWRAILIDLDGDGIDELVIFKTRAEPDWQFHSHGYVAYGYDEATSMAVLICDNVRRHLNSESLTTIFRGQDGKVYIRTNNPESYGDYGDFATLEDGQMKTVLSWESNEQYDGGQDITIFIVDGVEVDEGTMRSKFESYEAEVLFELSGGFWNAPDHYNNINDVLNLLRSLAS